MAQEKYIEQFVSFTWINIRLQIPFIQSSQVSHKWGQSSILFLAHFGFWIWTIDFQFSKYYFNIIYSCVPCICFKHFTPMEFIVQNKEMHVWATIVFTSF